MAIHTRDWGIPDPIIQIFSTIFILASEHIDNVLDRALKFLSALASYNFSITFIFALLARGFFLISSQLGRIVSRITH